MLIHIKCRKRSDKFYVMTSWPIIDKQPRSKNNNNDNNALVVLVVVGGGSLVHHFWAYHSVPITFLWELSNVWT